ncbi:MAG TPA: tetratricopeptide repeat protein [Blastocatellia bacterium]|nr:tetratricopeptide repeat protein [Blastocatellia bacterium]
MKTNTGIITKRAIAIMSISVLLLTTGLAQEANVSETARSHFVRAKQLSDQGEFARAAVEYGKAIAAANRLYPEAHNHLGMMLGLMGDIDSAIGSFKTAIKQDAAYPEAHYNLGLALSLKGDDKGAERELLKAIELSPGNFAEAHNNLGILYARRGDSSRAVMEFKIAVEQSSGLYPDAHYNLGIALFSVGRVEAAVREFRDAIDQSGPFPEAHYNLATALTRLGRNDEAAREFEMYLQLAENPKDSEEVRARISNLRRTALK